MSKPKPSTLAWIAVHLLYPLCPFLLEGLIRLAVDEGHFSFDTFRASTLSMSVGLVAVFVNQSLKMSIRQVEDEVEAESIGAASTAFLIIAIAFFVLYGLLVLLNALIVSRHLAAVVPLLRIFQAATFVGWVVPVVSAVVAQRSFKLRATVR
jgi:uncharacterized membrane protein